MKNYTNTEKFTELELQFYKLGVHHGYMRIEEDDEDIREYPEYIKGYSDGVDLYDDNCDKVLAEDDEDYNLEENEKWYGDNAELWSIAHSTEDEIFKTLD